MRAGSLYFDQAPLVWIGRLTTLVLFSGPVGLEWRLLRGTSRAHRVFRESLFVLGIGVPLSPFVVASDVNIAADNSSPTVVTAVVSSTHTTVTRSRRGGSRPHYCVDLKSTDSATLSVPKQVEVSKAIYGNARPGSRLEIVMRNGALGVP